MGFQINTNIASLQAQDYLRVNSDFQTKTISRVTSGLRITASGDDAAGLAIANGFRSDIAMLTQGIRNANDGLSTLQTIDGGINNISKLLDRARTLATQSASGTFAGNRSVLNQEFQSVIQEINRQAQAIGLDSGGQFAKVLTTFIGGGRANGGVSEIANGTVSVDLSNSKVDARSLGLAGLEAAGLDGPDLSDSSATSVQNIVQDATNINSAGDEFDFLFYGPGFGDSDRIKVSVSRNGVTNMATLTAAINSAIESAGNGTSAAATAFKNAGIKAVVKTDSDGSQRLAFTSANTAFQVRAGDRMANALLGNVTSTTNPTGKSLDSTVTGGKVSVAGSFAAATDTIIVRFQGGGLTAPVDISIDTNLTSLDTAEEAIAYLSSQVAQNAALQAAGITMTGATAGSALEFTNAYGERFEVLASGDLQNRLGLGAYRLSNISTGSFEYTTITGSGASLSGAETATFQIALSGENAASVSVTVTTPANVNEAVAALNAGFLNDPEARAAQLVASNSGGNIQITSQNGTYFRLNVHAATVAHVAAFGFGGTAETTASVANAQGGAGLTTTNTFYSGGASMVEATDNHALAFNAIRYATDDQTITVSVADVNGVEKSKVITLKSDGLSGSARSGITIDEAVREINRVLQSSNDSDFQKIVAVKERIDNNKEGIRFLSGAKSFKVSLGATANTMGVVDKVAGVDTQSRVVSSEVSEGGSTLAIDTKEAAQNAVGALATAVSLLGQAQAAVGRGQNQHTFAINLAQSQITNIAAAESRIRDADLALEAANMTKAQIMLQAGIAALAQANAAPQAVLALLRG